MWRFCSVIQANRQESDMDYVYHLLRFFQDGGPFMYPIGVVFLVGIAVVIERWFYLNHALYLNRAAFDQIVPLLQRSEFAKITRLAADSSAPIARMIGAGVARMSTSRRRGDIELAMEEGVLEAIPALQRRTGYLAMLANIATLLGLLGTIIGLIAAFTAVAAADQTQKATLLSLSISVAMNTTAFGLMSAIPLLLFHSLLVSKTTEIVDSLEMASVKSLNIIAGMTAAVRAA
jgi:biopolymer transport protein ExbB/TolQ